MKICVLAPSASYLAGGGVRVRYRRIERPLAELGHELTVLPITEFERPEDFQHDVYIVSKCYDARSLVAAQLISARGRLLGVDLFDDYFSQTTDSRFTRLRAWLTALLASSDFILCSTPAMQRLAARLAPNHPAHVLNDPHGELDLGTLGAAVTRKLDRLHESRALRVAWFGVGDNPHFPTGLTDLVAYGVELARLRATGFDVRLDILTNRRALTTNALAMLRRLPVAFELDEWSVEREADVLADCAACLLPVNAQPFSVAKSLNRAVTALTTGTQVLSAGFPLYQSLSPFIYRDAARLLADLSDRRPLLRQETLEPFIRLMEIHASPIAEAAKLAAFLQTFSQKSTAEQKPLVAVVHGQDSPADTHRFIQSMGGLSVASPFTKQLLRYDLRFVWNAPGLTLLIASDKRRLLAPELAAQLVPDRTFLGARYDRLALDEVPGLPRWDTALGRLQNPAATSVVFAEGMAFLKRVLAVLLPGIASVASERSSLPWRPSTEREVA